MKTSYITFLIFAIVLLIFLFIYFIEIPAPSKNITEIFNLNIEWLIFIQFLKLYDLSD